MLALLVIVATLVLSLVAIRMYGVYQWQQVIDSARVHRHMKAAREYRRMCRGR